MPEEFADVEEGLGESSDSLEPDAEGDAADGEQSETEEDGVDSLPLHLHARGKELVAEKNRYKELVSQYQSFGSPADLARMQARLEIAEGILAEDVPEQPRGPRTQEDIAKASERQWAREQLLDLLPEVREYAQQRGVGQTQRDASAEVFNAANAELAWEETITIAEELGMEPRALSRLTIPTIAEDRRLARLFAIGRSDQAVRGAVKKLTAGLGKGASADIKQRAAEMRQAEETSTRLPRSHTPGGRPSPPKSPKVPTTWDEAGERAVARLEKAKMFSE